MDSSDTGSSSTDSSGDVIVVSGPPGAGKTTVSAALADTFERSVHLESDWFFRFIRSGFVAPHLPESHEQNTAVMDIVIDVAAGYAAAGNVVVWDGIVGPWFLDRVVARLASHGITPRYLVLRPSLEVGLERVSARDQPITVSGAQTMGEQFADLGDYEAHVIDSDGPVADVVAACQKALEGNGLSLESGAWVDDRWPVSVKGIVGWDDRVVVVRNRRDEWELPGGRLDATDTGPIEALRREIQEELFLDVEVGPLIDAWIYPVAGTKVLILTYACIAERPPELAHSDEHTAVAALTLQELEGDSIPEGYLRSIRSAAR